jgi:hypothetical protein
MPNPWSGPGGDDWTPQPRGSFAKIPRLQDYQPTEADRKAEYWQYRAKMANAQPQQQGGRRTINVDLGGAFANTKAMQATRNAGPGPAARQADAWKVYDAEIAVQKAEAAQADRETDNARQAAHLKAMDEDRRTNQGNLERNRVSDDARAASEFASRAAERAAALAATKDYREEMSSFRKSELGRGVARDAESKRQHDENLAFRRDEAAQRPAPVDSNAKALEGLWMKQATDPDSPGGINITENEKSDFRNVSKQFGAARQPAAPQRAAAAQGIVSGGSHTRAPRADMAQTNPVPKTYKTPEDVKAAVGKGLSTEEAMKILKTQFGYDD